MMEFRSDLSRLVKEVEAAYPGDEKTLRNVVYVETLIYAMKRFSEGAGASEIFEEINEALRTEKVRELSELVQRARREWTWFSPKALHPKFP